MGLERDGGIDGACAGLRARPAAGRRRLCAALALVITLALAGLAAPSALAFRWHFHDVFTCKSVSFSWEGFEPVNNNVLHEKVKIDNVLVYSQPYVFNGSSGHNVVTIAVPPGLHHVSAYAEFNTNGVKGESDQYANGGIECGAEPSLSIEKLQQLGGGGFTTEEVVGKTGQKVEYRIVVTNTGNVPLKLTGFTDEKCDPGTLKGGPGEAAVEPLRSTVYTCSHILGAAGPYTNQASVTGDPPEGDGSPLPASSNTVVANAAPEPAFTIEKLQEIAGSGGGYTKSELAANVGGTVKYEIVVKNTGNAPLTFGNFTDEKCDFGTLTGGPSEESVEPGHTTTYFCTHAVSEADAQAHTLANSATDTGTPPAGDGSPATNTSNTVLVEVPKPKPHLKDTFTCNTITFAFTGFPQRPNNTVTVKVKVDGVLVYEKQFVFNGPTATDVVKLAIQPGHHGVSAYVEWVKGTNGVKGESDVPAKGGITCEVEPRFTLEKLQQIAGSGGPFTSGILVGHVGETVNYEIVASNTGNVPLTFSNVTDEKCDAGTITGGPGANPVEPEHSTTWTCQHLLSEEDKTAGFYANSATVTGSPPENSGSPVTNTSNTVVVEIPQAH